MTLKLGDFAIIAKRPWALLLGVAAQYAVMPVLGWGIGQALGLSAALVAGMVLVGASPGGTSSNVMVYLAKGDTALSVAMTSVSTLLAPLLTPVLVLALAGEFLPVDTGGLFVSILKIVLVPVVLGVLLRLVLPQLIERIVDVLPLVSVAGIGRLCRLDTASKRAVGIEVGMQNSGLAAALATIHFNPVAALPAAVFSVWHNVSGSLVASYWSRRGLEPDEQE